jgi:hypothetical protein
MGQNDSERRSVLWSASLRNTYADPNTNDHPEAYTYCKT